MSDRLQVATAKPLGMAIPSIFDGPDFPAQMSNGPRYEVDHFRTSTVFSPKAISDAHGWRTVNPFMFASLVKGSLSIAIMPR